jgi:hypothetical protein
MFTNKNDLAKGHYIFSNKTDRSTEFENKVHRDRVTFMVFVMGIYAHLI